MMAKKLRDKLVGSFSCPVKFDIEQFNNEYNKATSKAKQEYIILSPFKIDISEFEPEDGVMSFDIRADRYETENEKKWRLEQDSRQKIQQESRQKEREKADYDMYLALKKRFEGEKS